MKGVGTLACSDALIGTPVPPCGLGQTYEIVRFQTGSLVGGTQALVRFPPRVPADRFASLFQRIVQIGLQHDPPLDGATHCPIGTARSRRHARQSRWGQQFSLDQGVAQPAPFAVRDGKQRLPDKRVLHDTKHYQAFL